MILIGNQMVYSWNYSLISLVSIWLHILIIICGGGEGGGEGRGGEGGLIHEVRNTQRLQ